jgi:predicted ribosomally synthesized peptide with SipW-like signal peptide
MRRILLSAGMLVFAGAVVIGATGAFFSDTETSTGNLFAAGAIDLQIDNTSYGFDYNDPTNPEPIGDWGQNQNNSWGLSDLTDQLFFDFHDLKPGDYGEDTISIHVNDNDAWACMAMDLTGTPENGFTEPEEAVDETPGVDEGELQNYLSFLFWYDDGDNVLEDGEEVIEELSGLPGSIFTGDWLPIAESGDNPLPGEQTVYIGKGWCFGDIQATPTAQAVNQGGPTPGNTGFTCNGEGNHNDAQTDGIVVDVSFYAEQSRNNPEFQCGDLEPFEGEGDLERPQVGALLSAYVQPTGNSCDLTVDDSGGADHTDIQTAIDQAVPGSTICVAEGTYNQDVVIDVEGLTLSGDGALATSVINGQAAGQGTAVRIAADNVTVEGFEINGAGIAGLWVNTGVSGATIQYNHVTSANGSTAITTQGSQNNHVFQHNVLTGDDASQVAYVNGNASLSQPSDNVDFLNNTFAGTIISGGVVLGNEATNSSIDRNVFDTSGSTYGLVETFASASTDINENNFNASTVIKVRNGDDGGTLNAENNWWGDLDPSDNIFQTVDFDPFENSAFPEN